MPAAILNDKLDSIIEQYNLGHSMSKISRNFNCNPITIKHKLIKCGIVPVDIDSRDLIQLSDFELDVINGELLGDGSILYGNSYSKNARFTQGNLHKEYCDYLASIIPVKSVVYGKWDGNGKSKNLQYEIKTRSRVCFTKLRQEWYPNGIKIVPNNLKLNKTNCLHWYMRDGSINYKSIGLYTNGFTFNNCNHLVSQLQLLGFNAKVRPVKRTDGKIEPVVVINKDSTSDFLDFMGRPPINCFNYKWDNYGKRNESRT